MKLGIRISRPIETKKADAKQEGGSGGKNRPT